MAGFLFTLISVHIEGGKSLLATWQFNSRLFTVGSGDL